jgi:chromosomal replication initiator protein
MNNQLERIWQKTLGLLKNEVSSISYNTWVKTIKPFSINADTIELGVVDSFIKGILETRYTSLIKNAVEEASSREYEIKFITYSRDGMVSSIENKGSIQNEDICESVLNPKYTFDTFVIGNSNRLAHAASVAVSESPARAYNPLFLYGGVGLGKTHLMHAIGHYIKSQNTTTNILYVTSEKFTNELINAIRDDKNEQFRSKYRNIDILLIDDIQFIGGKERTQEEFFHTFNTLYEAERQIVISSDKPPKEITTLEDRLRSRFEWGLIADIQPPDLETRIAILRKKAQLEKTYVDDEILEFIADKIASNIRELEGALNRVIAYSSLTDNDVDLEHATEALKEFLDEKRVRTIDSNIIIDAVSRYFDMKIDDFKSKRRSRDITHPRQIAMFLCRELTDMSLPKIGNAFGGRDHTTVMHACDKIENFMNNNAEIKRTIEELKRNISGK